MGGPFCTDLSPTATNVVRGLESALEAVLRAMTWDLRTANEREDAKDRFAITGAPWRWHLVDGYLIEYRSLKKTESAKCPSGGFFVNSLMEATPAMHFYMRGKNTARRRRK
jgi:hypothetical protein